MRRYIFSSCLQTRLLSTRGRINTFIGKSHLLGVENIQTLSFTGGIHKRCFSNGQTSSLESATAIASNLQIQPIGTIFSDTGPVLAAQEILLAIKDVPGVTWIQTIVLGTIAIRLFFALPLSIVQHKSLARLENLQPELKKMIEDLNRETFIAKKIYKWDEKTAKRTFWRSYKKHWRRLVEENNCHPYRSISLALLQAPVWICFSSAIRNVVYQVPQPVTEEMARRWLEMNGEGTYWIDAITMVDPIVFPSVFVLASLTTIQLHSLTRASVPQTTLQTVVPWVLRIGVCGIGVLAMNVPAAVSMYWATSSVIGLIQNGAMMNSKVRRLLRIPQLQSQKSSVAVT